MSNYWNCVFVVQGGVSYLVGLGGEGGEQTIFILLHGSTNQKLVFLYFTHRTHTPMLPASCCSLSTETLVQKLLVYMKHFLIRLEINMFSSYKSDGDCGLVTIHCFRIRVWTLSFLRWGWFVFLILLNRELRLSCSEQHAKTSFHFPWPLPLFLNIWTNNLIPETDSSFEMFYCYRSCVLITAVLMGSFLLYFSFLKAKAVATLTCKPWFWVPERPKCLSLCVSLIWGFLKAYTCCLRHCYFF